MVFFCIITIIFVVIILINIFSPSKHSRINDPTYYHPNTGGCSGGGGCGGSSSSGCGGGGGCGGCGG